LAVVTELDPHTIGHGVGIVGGAAVPHAPQFLTLPDTEDHQQVERMRRAMEDIGAGLMAQRPDVVLVASNDHLENFFLHCVAPFTFHCGAEVTGAFAGREFRWTVAGDLAVDLVRRLQDEGFDPAFTYSARIGYEFGIPLTFCGVGDGVPLLPLFVNAYVAPQPSSERCYALGRALARATAAAGVRAVVIASGGLSHYPGTDLYGRPDLATDDDLVERLRAGNLRALLGFDDAALDRTGNVEIRSWQVLAGALGERVPDCFARESSWHHDYVALGWTSAPESVERPLHYPRLRADRLALSAALYRLRMEPAARAHLLDDPEGFVEAAGVSVEERAALSKLDEAELSALGVHPLLAFLARLQVDIERRGRT